MSELPEPKNKKESIASWTQFELNQTLAESLVANNFRKPTIVQAQTLVHLQSHVDMIVAAKTGQGKTLCFGLPIIDIVMRRLEKDPERELDRIAGVIIAPTRELAIQIKDHLQAVIPTEYEDKIKVCAIVGGMSVEKQVRLLSYKPAIIVATPGRLWEMMSEQSNKYLLDAMPMTDVLVLDEADRMIQDGHFKEMHDILAHVYTQRLQMKNKAKGQNQPDEDDLAKKDEVMQIMKSNDQDSEEEEMKKNNPQIDWSKVKDLYDEDELVNEFGEQGFTEHEKKPKEDNKRVSKMRAKQLEQLQDDKFTKEYTKAGGIQHIICSATMTIDKQGRVTPRGVEKEKRLNAKAKEAGKKIEAAVTTVEQLCKILKFRSHNPKVIDLTSGDNQHRMPETLTEYAVKCPRSEKDLYLYYYLNQRRGESSIIFCNSIECAKRVSSVLHFLKMPNSQLHSKMQQRQRLKNLDKFRNGVQRIESRAVVLGTQPEDQVAKFGQESVIMVCTDVAARGLDIPNVQNVVHYQCPMNAEIYVHRSGRTARIGKLGQSLNLLASEDQQNFKTICKVLKKQTADVQMLDVKYSQLEMLRPLIDSSSQLEKSTFQDKKKEKSAQWIMKTAQEADLDLDDDLRDEVKQTVSGQKRLSHERGDAEELESAIKGEAKTKDRNREAQRKDALKRSYEKEKERELERKFANSHYLTPESIRYLNGVVKAKAQYVDQELVYAGLHSEQVKAPKFKRTENKKQRYKGRAKGSKHKPNNHRA